MADDTATLRLLVEVREGLEQVKALEAGYRTAVSQMAAATKAGLDPASAEFEQLRSRVNSTRERFIAAGEAARDAMRRAATATGTENAALGVLEGKLIVARAEMAALGAQSVTTMSEAAAATARPAAGVSLIGANVDTLGTKFSRLSKGLLAGFALGPVIGVISLLTEALGVALEKLQEFAIKQIAGGEGTVQLTAHVGTLSDSLNRLAAREDRLAQAQAEGIARQGGYRLSTDEVRAAVEAHNAALAAADVAFEKNTAAGASLEQRKLAIYERTIAQATAERDYTVALSGSTDAIVHQVGLKQQLTEKLLGGTAALNEEKATLLTVIAALEQHGAVNTQVSEKILAELLAVREGFTEYGKQVPLDLDNIIAKYEALTAAQRRNAEQARAVASPLAAPPASPAVGDAQKRVDALQREVDAMEEQQDAGLTTIQQTEALTAREDELHDAQIDLNRATLDGAKSLDTFGEANQQSASNVQETINQLRLAHGEIDQFGNVVGDASEVCTTGFEDIGAAALVATDGIDAQSASVAALAKGHRDGKVPAEALATSLDSLGAAGESAAHKNTVGGAALEKALGGANTGALTLEETIIRITDIRMAALIKAGHEFRAIFGGTGGVTIEGGN